jgi:hypothetical protein
VARVIKPDLILFKDGLGLGSAQNGKDKDNVEKEIAESSKKPKDFEEYDALPFSKN